MTHKVFLVRHGQTALNADGRLRGHLNPPLDLVGEQEVVAVASALSDWRIVKILSSPLLRALQTADAIAAVAGVTVTPVDELMDRDYGSWAGHLEADVVDRFGTVDAAPGVEPREAIVRRSYRLLEAQIIPTLDRGDVVMVSHDAVNRALLAALDPTLPRDLRQRTGCWNEIRRSTDGWQVHCVDQKPELDDAIRAAGPDR